jgi:hypothetical protein
MRSPVPRFLLLAILLFLASLSFISACRARQQEPQLPEYSPTASIRDIMQSIVDPSADVVWQAVQASVAQTIEEKAPRTDEEWTNVRHGAIRLIEATNLLIMPGRHVARPGDRSEAANVELEPEQMEALINKDRAAWNERAKALREAGLEALRAIDAKDANTLFEVGDRIEMACENCHLHYWYPNQKLPPGYYSGGR